MTVIAQRSFSSGVITPELRKRVDYNKFASALKTGRNAFVMRHGGLMNRCGSQYVAEAGDSTEQIRLVPFVINSEKTYVLEFGNLYMRVFKDRAQVHDGLVLTITAISTASEAVFTYTGSDPNNTEEVTIEGIVGPIGQFLNGRNFIVSDVNGGANTLKLKYIGTSTYVNSTAMGAYTSGGTISRVFELLEDTESDVLYSAAQVQELYFAQDEQIALVVGPLIAPKKLITGGDTSWSLSPIEFEPITLAPTSLSNNGNGGAGTTTVYALTSINDETNEESLISADTGTVQADPADGGDDITILATGNSTASTYHVYKKKNGVYGFIGVAGKATADAITFVDTGIVPDFSIQPPIEFNPFQNQSEQGIEFPSVVGFYQQRAIYGNSTLYPSRAWASRVGVFQNLTINVPSQDDSSFSYQLRANSVSQAVRHILDAGALINLASGAEFRVDGDNSGVVRAGASLTSKQSDFGASRTVPLLIDGDVVYLQARGSRVRALGFTFESDGFKGTDLSQLANHFFEGYNILAMAYQQEPHSVIWALRDDGKLLSLTYVRDQSIFAWMEHEISGGFVESIVSVPNDDLGIDDVYIAVRRTIDGVVKRYVEVLNDRRLVEDADAVDKVFVDSALSYDGRNTGSVTMTLSGGTNWTFDEDLTLTRSAAGFTSADVGNEIWLTGADDVVVKCEIIAFTSSTVVTVRPDKTVTIASGLRSAATTSWARAVDSLQGLWHLEGEEVAVQGDGLVEANPLNDQYDVITVSDGAITLSQCYAVIHVGLPYMTDIETLDVDTPDGETFVGKKKLINRVYATIEKTRGIWVGGSEPTGDDPLENMSEMHSGESGQDYVNQPILRSEDVEIGLVNDWNSSGRVFLRQIDPLPMCLVSIFPDGAYPTGGR